MSTARPVRRLSRRRFVQGAGLAGLGLLAGCRRLPGQAAQPPRMHRIGFLQLAASSRAPSGFDAFREGLHEFGYVDDLNIMLETRFADGDEARMRLLAAELVRTLVDVILAAVTAADVVKEATSTVPIVMVYPSDPIANGLVSSLARPGGNITGVTYFAGQLADKRLELLRDTVPSLTRVAILQQANAASVSYESARLESAARALGLQVQWLEVSEPEKLGVAFNAMRRERADALVVGGGNWFVPQRSKLVQLAVEYRLPATYWHPVFVHAGGLMAYAANIDAQFRRAAYYVNRILKGTTPADLPIEQPTTFDFIINLKTAQALGLTIPQHVLLQATDIIQ